MNKKEIKNGMKLKMKDGQFCTSELIGESMVFRFRDGTNQFISLNEYDDNLNCPIDNWSIVEEIHRELFPCQLPNIFMAKNIKSGKVYKCSYDRSYCDGYDVETTWETYNFNECEGVIDKNLYETKRERYYIINEYNEKVYVSDIVLIDDNGDKSTISRKNLLYGFEYILQ